MDRVGAVAEAAVVTVDESEVGKAPFGPLELLPGQHTVTVESERFLPFIDLIDIPGLDRTEVLHVQLVPRWANVSIESEPAGATIFSGEEEVGVTPATICVPYSRNPRQWIGWIFELYGCSAARPVQRSQSSVSGTGGVSVGASGAPSVLAGQALRRASETNMEKSRFTAARRAP